MDSPARAGRDGKELRFAGIRSRIGLLLTIGLAAGCLRLRKARLAHAVWKFPHCMIPAEHLDPSRALQAALCVFDSSTGKPAPPRWSWAPSLCQLVAPSSRRWRGASARRAGPTRRLLRRRTGNGQCRRKTTLARGSAGLMRSTPPTSKGCNSPEMTIVYLDIALPDLHREFDLACSHPRHATPLAAARAGIACPRRLSRRCRCRLDSPARRRDVPALSVRRGRVALVGPHRQSHYQDPR